MVLLNEGAPFIWEFDIDILFVRLLVSDLDISRAFVRCDTQLPMAFKAVHTANSSFFSFPMVVLLSLSFTVPRA